MIADGKELITGNERGDLIVPELKDEKVYITFKDDVTDFGTDNWHETRGTFYECTALTSIPANLFANCPKVTTFGCTFYGCRSLTSIPEGLFAHNPEVTHFGGADRDELGCFQYCTSLQSIPEGLFANNPKATSFCATFAQCYSLTSIPSSLFDNNRNILYLGYSTPAESGGTFAHCTNLTGESPYTMINGKKVHLYERKDYPDHFAAPKETDRPFNNCTGLTDYTTMPREWSAYYIYQ